MKFLVNFLALQDNSWVENHSTGALPLRRLAYPALAGSRDSVPEPLYSTGTASMLTLWLRWLNSKASGNGAALHKSRWMIISG